MQKQTSSTDLFENLLCIRRDSLSTLGSVCCGHGSSMIVIPSWSGLSSGLGTCSQQWQSIVDTTSALEMQMLSCYYGCSIFYLLIPLSHQNVPFFFSIEQVWSNISGNGHRYAICVVASYSSVAQSQWHLLLCGWLCVFFVAGTFTSPMQTEFLFIRNSGN